VVSANSRIQDFPNGTAYFEALKKQATALSMRKHYRDVNGLPVSPELSPIR
jgi:hypothetical protein